MDVPNLHSSTINCDTFSLITSRLNLKDLVNTGMVCKNWNNLYINVILPRLGFQNIQDKNNNILYKINFLENEFCFSTKAILNKTAKAFKEGCSFIRCYSQHDLRTPYIEFRKPGPSNTNCENLYLYENESNFEFILENYDTKLQNGITLSTKCRFSESEQKALDIPFIRIALLNYLRLNTKNSKCITSLKSLILTLNRKNPISGGPGEDVFLTGKILNAIKEHNENGMILLSAYENLLKNYPHREIKISKVNSRNIDPQEILSPSSTTSQNSTWEKLFSVIKNIIDKN